MSENLFDPLEDIDVCWLWVDITQQTEDHDWRVDNYIWLWILDERTVFNQMKMSILNVHWEVFNFQLIFLTLFAECHIESLNAKVACVSNCSVDIVTQPFEKLSCLGLYNTRLLFVTRIKSKCNKLTWFIIHILSLSLGGFDKIKSNIKNKVW